MKSEIAILLEAKKAERKETQEEFSVFLGMSFGMYKQIVGGYSKVPKASQDRVAEVLGIPVERLKFLSSLGKRTFSPDVLITGDELRYLAGIADAARAGVRLSLLLKHLENAPKKTT